MQKLWAYESSWHLVNNGLHMWLVDQISVQQRRPLLWWNSQTRLHSDVDDLSVVFSPQSLVRPKFFLKLHQRGVLITLGHLMKRTDGEGDGKEGELRMRRRVWICYKTSVRSNVSNKWKNKSLNPKIKSIYDIGHIKCSKQLIILHFGITASMESLFMYLLFSGFNLCLFVSKRNLLRKILQF